MLRKTKFNRFAILFGFSLCVLSSLARAETFTYVDGLTVKSVYGGYDKGQLFFDVDSDVANPNGCSAGGQRTVSFDPKRGNVDHVLSILLYAHASGKKVDIQVYDESCLDNFIVVRRVKVSDN